jgi:hypothetical protein
MGRAPAALEARLSDPAPSRLPEIGYARAVAALATHPGMPLGPGPHRRLRHGQGRQALPGRGARLGLARDRHPPPAGHQPADVAELVEHGATTVVLSRGVLRMLQVCPETVRELERDGVAVEVLPTPEAVERYNRLADREAAVGALIHSTC